MTPILETKSLVKAFYGVHAVDHVSFAFREGKITGVIGPNGSGKTTLINLLSGMFPIEGGSIVVSGVELEKIRPYDIQAYGITRTFQNARLFEQMSVLDNILVVLTERNVWSALFERHTKLHMHEGRRVLERMGLWEKRNEHVENLSYGQRKLLEIGRALATGAAVYLFDEPFAGLFPEMAKVVQGVMRELRAEGKTIVLIEHNMKLIRELSDYVFVMDSGRVLAEGEPEKVLAQRNVIEAYLGE